MGLDIEFFCLLSITCIRLCTAKTQCLREQLTGGRTHFCSQFQEFPSLVPCAWADFHDKGACGREGFCLIEKRQGVRKGPGASAGFQGVLLEPALPRKALLLKLFNLQK